MLVPLYAIECSTNLKKLFKTGSIVRWFYEGPGDVLLRTCAPNFYHSPYLKGEANNFVCALCMYMYNINLLCVYSIIATEDIDNMLISKLSFFGLDLEILSPPEE